MDIGKTFKDTCVSTSMKGVPRIIKAERNSIRFIWAISVMVFTGMAIYQTAEVVKTYLRYEKTTSITEKLLAMEDVEQGLLSMSLTVCNLQPIRSNQSVYQEEGIMTISEYFEFVEKTMVDLCNENCTDGDKIYANSLKSFLLSHTGYYQYLGKEKAKRIGHKHDDFIVACWAIVGAGVIGVHVPCDMLYDVREISIPYHFNCFTYEHKPIDLNKDVLVSVGIRFTFFLDNFAEDVSVYNPGEPVGTSSFESGAKIIIHMKNHYPMVRRDYVKVEPGHHMTLKIELDKRIRLPPPHGPCSENASDVAHNWRQDGRPVAYDSLTCGYTCEELFFLETLKCYPVIYMGLLEWQYPGLKECFRLANKTDLSTIVSLWNQALKVANASIVKNCYNTCKQPCFEGKYQLIHTTQSKWPSGNALKAFYKEMVQNKTYTDKFSVYSSEKNNSKQIPPNLIHDNFAKATIFYNDISYLQLKDEIKLTVPTFFSQLGGVLNLWAGITVILVVEFIEFFYKLILDCLEKKVNINPKKIEEVVTKI